MLVLAKAFHSASSGLPYGLQIETGLLRIHRVPRKRARLQQHFAQHLLLVSTCIALLQNVKNMTIKIIKFVGFIRCAATRQKGFHVHC